MEAPPLGAPPVPAAPEPGKQPVSRAQERSGCPLLPRPHSTGLPEVIYRDYNATIPVRPEVRQATLSYLWEAWGNPSSSYRFGAALQSKIELAREQTAALIGARFPREVLFTSGTAESNNTAIHAAMLSRPGKKHIITSHALKLIPPCVASLSS